MTNKKSTWIHIVRNVKLTTRERDVMRQNLIQFMEVHPVRNVENHRLYFTEVQHMMRVRLLSLRTYKTMFIGILIALVMGGSVSFAAENTLPGDALYPVKVFVNENARAAVAFTDKSKAELAVELANRRLEEAGKLAVRGTLDSTTEAKLSTDVEAHVKDAREKLVTLKSHDAEAAAEVGVDLNSVLSAHSIVLAKAKHEKEKEHNTDSVHALDALGSVLARIESEQGDDNQGELAMDTSARMGVATMMMHASSTVSVTREAAEGKKNAAQNKLTEVARKLGNESTGATASTTAQVKFAEAQKIFAQGEISLNAGAYADAFYAFKQTIQLAQQAKRLADLETEFTGEFSVNLHGSDDESIDDEDNSTTTINMEKNKRKGEEGEKENSPNKGTRVKTSVDQGMEMNIGGHGGDDTSVETEVENNSKTHIEGGNSNININTGTKIGL